MPLEQFLIYCYLRPPKALNQQKLKTKRVHLHARRLTFQLTFNFSFSNWPLKLVTLIKQKSLEFANEKCHQQNNHFMCNRDILTAHSLCKMFLIQTKGLYRDVSLFIIPSATRNSSSYTQQNK